MLIAECLQNYSRYPHLFSEEIHRAFVLTAIILFRDIAPELFTVEEHLFLVEFIEKKTRETWQESHSKPWGRKEKQLNIWNHRIIPFSGLAIATISLLNYLPEAQEWLNVAMSRVEDFFIDGITDQGMTREGLWYCGFVSKILGILLRICRQKNIKVNGEFLDDKYSDKLDRLVEWYLYESFPRGKYLNNWNDSYWNPHPGLWGYLTIIGNRNPSLVTYVWELLVGSKGLKTYGRDPNLNFSSLFDAYLFLPQQPVAEFKLENTNLSIRRFCSDIGYLNLRNSWPSEATIVSLNCGKYIEGIHDQSDNNSFTLIFEGQPLVIDSGAANDTKENSPSSSLGHNLVLIDGKGQRFSGRGNGVSGKIIKYDYSEVLDYILGDATESYNLQNYNPVNFAIRHLCFVREPFPYVVTFDDIEPSNFSDGKFHLYEYLLHIPKSFNVEKINHNQFRLKLLETGNTGSFILRFFNQEKLELKIEQFQSKHHHSFANHNLLRFSTRAINPHFLAIFISEKNLENLNLKSNINVDKSRIVLEILSSEWSDNLELKFYRGKGGSLTDKLFKFQRTESSLMDNG
ncbi:MAG: hypothetical protein F6K39_17240 [Okeania sp. SIO3B3]|nr:hypothetical protein [Okeania sp. SIO3B3]